MRLQIIICVETNKQTKSDWIYISETINYFYQYDKSEIKLSPLYLNGKGNYKSNKVIREIESLKKQFIAGSTKGGDSVVIYAFDTDEYLSASGDIVFLEEAKQYCENNDYDFVWFCKDVEQVYLKRRIPNNTKKKEAERFLAKGDIKNIDKRCLNGKAYSEGKSNLIVILDKYLKGCRIEINK